MKSGMKKILGLFVFVLSTTTCYGFDVAQLQHPNGTYMIHYSSYGMEFCSTDGPTDNGCSDRGFIELSLSVDDPSISATVGAAVYTGGALDRVSSATFITSGSVSAATNGYILVKDSLQGYYAIYVHYHNQKYAMGELLPSHACAAIASFDPATGCTPLPASCYQNAEPYTVDSSFSVPSAVEEVFVWLRGASGGGEDGGAGALISGSFSVNPEDNLNVFIGQAGTGDGGCNGQNCGGGGGGSAVTIYNNNGNDAVLAVAGGGGGGHTGRPGGAGGRSSGLGSVIINPGKPAGIPDGVNGVGGTTQGSSGGGGGAFNDSGDSVDAGAGGGGAATLNTTGDAGDGLHDGGAGFGGGGGSGASAGGGGGGYDGGNSYSNGTAAEGGSSFYNSEKIVDAASHTAGENSSDGEAIICWADPSPSDFCTVIKNINGGVTVICL